jgi:hypothetical protein
MALIVGQLSTFRDSISILHQGSKCRRKMASMWVKMPVNIIGFYPKLTRFEIFYEKHFGGGGSGGKKKV